jgi:hypothetical protein
MFCIFLGLGGFRNDGKFWIFNFNSSFSKNLNFSKKILGNPPKNGKKPSDPFGRHQFDYPLIMFAKIQQQKTENTKQRKRRSKKMFTMFFFFTSILNSQIVKIAIKNTRRRMLMAQYSK